MLDSMVEKARQQEVFTREDTPLRRRVLAAFLYHADLSSAESNRSLIGRTRRSDSGFIG
jgi:hypothetical protein